MAKSQLPIANGFYVSESLPISSQQCVNFYPNVPQSDTVTHDNLFNTPGLVELLDLSSVNDICRGSHVMDSLPYFVVGNRLERVDRVVDGDTETFSNELIGAIEGVSRVYMADNGNQLCVVAVPDATTTGITYIYDKLADTFEEVTDVDFDGPAGSVVYLDGFFVFHKVNSKKIFNSAISDGRGLPDGTAYDAFDFTLAVADPDNIRALSVYRNQLYALGSENTEIFRNIGRSPAPFQSLSGGGIDIGIFAPQTAALFGGAIAFIGGSVNESPAVWMIAGAQKKKISTTAIDNELSKLAELTGTEDTDVFAWVYAESGAYFYGLTLPDTTFVYDQINQRWHERRSIDGTDVSRYRVASMVTAYGRVMVGDLLDGRIGQIDESSYTEYNFLSRRFVTTKPFDSMGDAVFVSSIEVVVESGVGLESDVDIEAGINFQGVPIEASGGADPQITLSFSDDGGRTFEDGRARSMGKLGEYNRRPIWRRLGRFPRSRVIMLEVSSPTKATLIKMEADIG